MEDNNDDTTDDRFLFDINIKKVSESKNLDILINEWVKYEPMFDTEQEIKGQCICNRYIKYINYFYNKINGNIIMVGDTCKVKLKFKDTIDEDDNKYVKMIISKGKGTYKNISDIMDYNIDVLQQVMALITYDVELTNGIENINKLLDTLNKLISIQQILVKNKDFYDFIKCKIIILEERKQIIEEELKLDEETERELKEYETEKQNVKLHFEEGYYINIQKNNKDTYKESILIEYLKQQNNKYIQSFIDKYKDNTYLYDKIKKILDNKLYFINLKKKEAEDKKKKEEELENIRINKELEKDLEKIKIIDNQIKLYNSNIEKWKLMEIKKHINETSDDYIKRIIYTKNGPLKINDIILLNDIEIYSMILDETNHRYGYNKKHLEDKIRQIIDIESLNDNYLDIDKPWLINNIDYTDFIQFDINTICDLTIKFNILKYKKLQYLRDNQNELEFYIRYTLGQKIFINYNYYNIYNNYNYGYYNQHLKFDYDGGIDFNKPYEYVKDDKNQKIIDLFNNFYNDKKIIFKSHKGTCYATFIDKNNKIINNIEYPGGDKGTIMIIIDILNKI